MKHLIVSLFSFLIFTSGWAGITPGQPAPDFSAPNQDGKTVKLSDLKGKPVLLYFYPKDDTPGCTKEACNFRDEFSKFKESGTVILGVSRQDQKSHQEFKKKHRLPFDLLVDKDGALAKSFGVETMAVVGYHKRQSVLIGPDGKVARFYADVDPQKHTQEVLKDLQELKKK
jgi:thioredoxin-dependent peroxiredoxin